MQIEKIPSICPECHGRVVLGDNSVRLGKAYGNEKLYFCLNCKAYAKTIYNEELQLYEASEHIQSNSTRRIKRETILLIEQLYKRIAPESLYMKAYGAFFYMLSKELNMSFEECSIEQMSRENLIKTKIKLSGHWKEYEKEVAKLVLQHRKKNI